MTWKATREARDRLIKERGTVHKDWGGRMHIALIYPNSYYLGMSSLGFQTIYGFLNSYENIVCERVFWEPKKPAAEAPISLESQRPLPDFDILAFSISYELDYFNVIQIFKAAGIPLNTADRDEGHPLIIAGGSCVTANPQPLSPFFDCFAIGEGEAILPGLVDVITDGFESSKNELQERLAALTGIYAPSLYSGVPINRQWLAALDTAATTSVILTPDTEFSDMYLIEIARGCGRGCRFCLAGYWFRPFRPRPINSLLRQAGEGIRYSGRIGLLGAAVSDHPEIDELILGLRRMGAAISVSSLRIRPLSGTLIRALAESGTQTVSLAPEAGSERLRRTINKGASEDDIIGAVDIVSEAGLRQVKLYFMIGLPTETDDDIEEIIRMALTLKSRIERTGCRISLTVEPFVPKAGTPFQWLGMATENVLNHRINRIKHGLTKSGIDVRTESVAWSLVQGMLSRGDARVGATLAGMSRSSLAGWRRSLEEHNLNAKDYIHRDLPPDEQFPWSVVDSGVICGYLRDELKKAHQGAETPACPPEDCQKCGVC
jgi:radical SAM superfamily enzyme YgiQ (UPF0313 family)